MGRRDCLAKKYKIFYKGGRSGRWETHKKYGHPKAYLNIVRDLIGHIHFSVSSFEMPPTAQML